MLSDFEADLEVRIASEDPYGSRVFVDAVEAHHVSHSTFDESLNTIADVGTDCVLIDTRR